MINNFNKKGFTIVEGLISLAVIGISSVAVLSLMNSYQQQVRNVEVKTGFEGALSQALDEAHRMLRETDDGKGNLTIGACSLMATSQLTPGLGLIRADMPVADPFSAETKVWGWGSSKRSIFPATDWTSSDCQDLKDSKSQAIFPAVKNSYQRCFKPIKLESTPPFGLPLGLTPSDPVFRVVVSPLRIRVEGKTDAKGNKITSDEYKGYQVITLPTDQTNKTDARDVALLLTAEISYKADPQGDARISKTQSLLRWLGEFQCHKITTTSKIVMRPSGFGSGDDRFSLFSASENSDQTVFDAKHKIKIFTEGTVIQERGVTLLKNENLAAAACVEKPVFNCKFKTKTEDVWRPDSLAAVLKIKYNRNNALYDGSSIFVKPSISLRSASNNLGDNAEDIPLDSNFSLANSNPALPNTSVNNGLTISSSRIDLFSDAKAPAKACTQVCSPSNKFNTDTNPYILNYSLFSSALNKAIDVKDSASRVGCVCCYGKQCAAIGTKLQSWCGQQPDEALDSRVPECASDYANPSTQAGLKDLSGLHNSATNTKLSIELNNTPDANCLVGEKSSDKITVSSESCDSKKRVLCYSNGRFILTPKEFVRKDASQACHDLSAESMLASEVDDRVTSQINGMSPDLWSKVKLSVLPPVKNGRYVFRNAAMAGIFLSPQENVQLSAVINGSDVPKSTEFWIALRTNKKGETVAALPLMPPNISPYVSYFDGDGRLIFLKENNVCTAANPGDCLPYNTVSDGPVILQHARTRFGASVIDSATVKEEFAALCFNPTSKTFFKSTGKTKVQSDAIALCMRENGIFVAPVRPLQWIASLKAVKQIFNQLPFPMYSKDETLAAGIAWTSLTAQAGNYAQILPTKPADTCLVDKEFKAIPFDVKNQTPVPMFHLKREGNKLVLASGELPEGSTEQWVLNEDDFMDLSLEILNKKPQNIQFKECEKPLPSALKAEVNGAVCDWDGWKVDYSIPKANGYNFAKAPPQDAFPKGAVATCCKAGAVLKTFNVTDYAGGVDPWSCSNLTGFPATCPAGTTLDQAGIAYRSIGPWGWSTDFSGTKCGGSNLYKYVACLPPCTDNSVSTQTNSTSLNFGPPQLFATASNPRQLVVDPDLNVYVLLGNGNPKLVKISGGSLTTINVSLSATPSDDALGVTFNSQLVINPIDKNMLAVNTTTSVIKINPSAASRETVFSLERNSNNYVEGVAFNKSGDLFASVCQGVIPKTCYIKNITTSNTINLQKPVGTDVWIGKLLIDNLGDFYMNFPWGLRKLDPSSGTTTSLESSPENYLALDSNTNTIFRISSLKYIRYNKQDVVTFDPFGANEFLKEGSDYIAVDKMGSLYFSQFFKGRIIKIPRL